MSPEPRRITLAEVEPMLAASLRIEGISFPTFDLRAALENARRETAYTFIHCDFGLATLRNATLIGSVFEDCRFDEADLEGADLGETRWSRISGTKLSASRIAAASARFERCNFANADFSRANLFNTTFQTVRFTGANLSRAQTRNTNFDDCHLAMADARQLSFKGRRIRNVDFTDALLAETDFRDATFDGCCLRGARLIDAKFAGADLRGADLGPVTLADCGALRGAIISVDQAGELLRGLGLRVM